MAAAGQGQQAAAAAEGRSPEQQQKPPLRSITSQVPSFVRFVNRTQRQVNVFWLDYKGAPQKYKCLNPGEYYNINTYVTHPWVFRDAETNATLLVNSEEVFFPKPYPALQEGHVVLGPVRHRHMTALISIPLYTLRDRAAQVVRSCLRDPKEAYTLDIPQVLMNILAKVAV